MGNLSKIGRIFYGIAIAAIGFLTIFYRDFPYFLIPPKHTWITGHVLLVYLSGALLFLAGVCIVLEEKAPAGFSPLRDRIAIDILILFYPISVNGVIKL